MGRSNMCNIHTAKKTERTQEEITISGNPAKPQGEDGATMLKRMNESHSPVTCWALEHWQIAPEEELLDMPSDGHRLFTGVCENLAENESTGCGKRKDESSGRLRGSAAFCRRWI